MQRAIAVVLLTCFAFTGCHKWVQVGSLRSDVGSDAQTVRLTRTDGTRFSLYRASVRRDSLVGLIYKPGYQTPRDSRRAFALPLESVERVETRASDPVATVGLGLGIAALIGLMKISFESSFTLGD